MAIPLRFDDAGSFSSGLAPVRVGQKRGYVDRTGTTYGVYGQSSSTSGRGVCGYADAASGIGYGVHGQSDCDDGCGVYGYCSATSGWAFGVKGVSDSTFGHGVYGWANGASSLPVGVYGYGSGYGVYFVNGLAGTGTKSCVIRTSRGSDDDVLPGEP